MPITASTPLEYLRAVANSYHEPEARDEGWADGPRWLPAHDHLDDAVSAMEFFQRSGIRMAEAPQARHLERLREIRAAARALVGNRRAYERRTARLLARARFRVDGAGRLLPTRKGWDGLIDGLLLPLVELRDHAARLKVCDNDQCRWLFIDQSKNRSRQWCESASCGNRQRVRRFRRRLEAA
jgi:predicted RNA-binding Zn ribbon-like protein